MSRIIISTLAEYQTEFWVEVGLELAARGIPSHFISFDSRSNEMLAEANLEFTDATPSARRHALGDRRPLDVCEEFGVGNPNFWMSHERIAFGLRDGELLARKLAEVLAVVDGLLERLEPDATMVQELGGFLSVLGCHFASMRRGVPSWFIEPSVFRGRMLFLKNTIAAKKFGSEVRGEVAGPAGEYITDTLASRAIVIPKKDSHHYNSAIGKVLNFGNAKRLAQKLVDKHLLGKEQEFGHIGGHVSTHLNMLRQSRKLRNSYTPLEGLNDFVYYPLHVPGDVALTLRSPEYLDQIALIDLICRMVPHGYNVAVKEHPAMIGAIGSEGLLGLKRRYDHFSILPPTTNNFDVLAKSSAVVTVNSKSGAEAGLLGKQVLTLGDAFYRDAPFSQAIESTNELAESLAALLRGPSQPIEIDEVHGYFAGIWPETLPGELYSTDKGNIDQFTTSLEAAIR